MDASAAREMWLRPMSVVWVCLVMLTGIRLATATQADCELACGAFTNATSCLGTIAKATGFASNGSSFSTSNGFVFPATSAMTCGSQEPGLNTVFIQFQVEARGLYTIETANIGDGDSVMQVMTCSEAILGCNDEADNSTHNSRLQLSLEPGMQYVAAISNYDSHLGELDFDLLVTAECGCKAFAVTQCFGKKQDGLDLMRNQLSLEGLTHQRSLTCGSGASDLNQFVFHFEVESDGMYSISTQNIGGSDSTMAIYTCEDGQLVGCNDDIGPTMSTSELSIAASSNQMDLSVSASDSVRSMVTARLAASTAYVGVVTKYNNQTFDLTFDLVIAPSALAIPPTDPTSTSSESNTGMIVGAVLGAFLAVTVLVAGLVWKQRQSSHPSSSSEPSELVIETASHNRKTGEFQYNGPSEHDAAKGTESVRTSSRIDRKTGQFEELVMWSSAPTPPSPSSARNSIHSSRRHRSTADSTTKPPRTVDDWKRRSIAASGEVELMESDNPLFVFPREESSEPSTEH